MFVIAVDIEVLCLRRSTRYVSSKLILCNKVNMQRVVGSCPIMLSEGVDSPLMLGSHNNSLQSSWNIEKNPNGLHMVSPRKELKKKQTRFAHSWMISIGTCSHPWQKLSTMDPARPFADADPSNGMGGMGCWMSCSI